MDLRHGSPPGWPDYWKEYDEGRWEPGTHQHILDLVTPGSTYVDIGAWVGPTVLWAAPIAGRVIAVEPDPVALEALTYNTRSYPNVEIIRAAINNTTGTARIMPYGGDYGTSMTRLADHQITSIEWDASKFVEVDCYTLPDLFDQFDITDVSLVKMDIEGGEADVLDVVAPYLADKHIPLLCSLHQDWYSHPLPPNVFSCYREIREVTGGAPEILAIP